jgi:hypothetical protein
MKRYFCAAVLCLLAATVPANAQDEFEIKHLCDSDHPVICIPLSLTRGDAATVDGYVLYNDDGLLLSAPAQLTAPGLLTEQIKPSAGTLARKDFHFVLPSRFKAKTVTNVKLLLNVDKDKELPQPGRFAWKDQPGQFVDLLYGKQQVMRYMYKAFDATSQETKDKTYKVFHHLFDPEGKRLVTNGGQTNEPLGDPKKLLYPHHRGLMYAFNNITYGKGIKADTWHAKPENTHQSHEGFLLYEAGFTLGRHRVAVDWHGPKKDVFAKEEREFSVYKIGKGTLIEFASRLKAVDGTVKLDGDPQHAGFQFRAHNDVALSSKDKTYYLRPDGKGGFGEKNTRNWDLKTKKGPVNLPWDACSFVIDGKRYTVVYLNHPKNPGESRWSERDYARFGCYFAYELTEQNPLVVNYRIWLQEGEMTVDQCEALHKAFASPPTVTIK